MLELTTETHKTIIETHSYSWKINLKNHCKSESVVGAVNINKANEKKKKKKKMDWIERNKKIKQKTTRRTEKATERWPKSRNYRTRI